MKSEEIAGTRGEGAGAGRELDALVAEEVMGVAICKKRRGDGDHSDTWCGLTADGSKIVPAYSEDISAAWLVVEKLHVRLPLRFELLSSGEMRFNAGVVTRQPDIWVARFVSNLSPSHFSEGKTPALAICRAALKAVASRVASPANGDGNKVRGA